MHKSKTLSLPGYTQAPWASGIAVCVGHHHNAQPQSFLSLELSQLPPPKPGWPTPGLWGGSRALGRTAARPGTELPFRPSPCARPQGPPHSTLRLDCMGVAAQSSWGEDPGSELAIAGGNLLSLSFLICKVERIKVQLPGWLRGRAWQDLTCGDQMETSG